MYMLGLLEYTQINMLIAPDIAMDGFAGVGSYDAA